jgi:hypothetical protein
MFATRAPGPATSPRLSLLVMAMLGAMALPLPGWALDLPRAGVICDASQQICYDLQGPSLAQTRREFGRGAEQELLRSISGRPPAREIRFSSGEICDLRRQICWDDGTRRENISRRLTRQLFPTAGNDGWQDPLSESRCQLRQGGRRLFNGPCNLSTTGDLGNRIYLVEMGDGRRYSFTNRYGRLQLRDATGTWPVTTIDRGETVVFRWADLQLEASRPPRYDSGLGSSPAPDAYPSQPVLQQLIESLFR